MGAAVTSTERPLDGPVSVDRAQLASAVRAVEAAMSACESARLGLIALVQPELAPVLASGECPHPQSQWQAALTFGESVYFCSVCGEQVGV